MAERLANVRLFRRQEIVARNQRGIVKARGRVGGGVDEEVARIAAAAQIAGNHGDYGLAESLVIPVILDYDRRADLGSRRIRIWEFDEDNISALDHGLLPYRC